MAAALNWQCTSTKEDVKLGATLRLQRRLKEIILFGPQPKLRSNKWGKERSPKHQLRFIPCEGINWKIQGVVEAIHKVGPARSPTIERTCSERWKRSTRKKTLSCELFGSVRGRRPVSHKIAKVLSEKEVTDVKNEKQKMPEEILWAIFRCRCFVLKVQEVGSDRHHIVQRNRFLLVNPFHHELQLGLNLRKLRL